MSRIAYLIINLDTSEKLAQVEALSNCNKESRYGREQSLYSIRYDTHYLRRNEIDNSDRITIPSIEDIPRVKLLLSLGLSKEEILEILNE